MKNKKGFLLLEVVLTIVIIATGLIFVTRVYTTAGQIARRSMILFRSGLLAETASFAFEEKGKIQKEFSDQGDFKNESGYSWRIRSQEVPRESSFSAEERNINLVTLDIIYSGGNRPFVTYLKNKK